MKKTLENCQERLASLSLGASSWVEQRSRYNPAFVFSVVFHMAIFVTLFVSFSAGGNFNSSKFIPIGLEIADFRAGSLVKKSGYKNKKSDKIVTKRSENGDKFVKNENSGQAEAVQKSKVSKYNSYVELIAHELEKRKSRFSMDGAPEDMKVTVVFEVNLDESGNMKSYKVVKNSGNKFVDSIAQKIITCSKSFPTPPSEIRSMGLTFSIPIIFDSLA